MGAVTVELMREIEHKEMSKGVSEGELMELAGVALGRAVAAQFPEIGTAIAYLGKGHNAGDALIALRVLKEEFGWKTYVRAAFPRDEWAELNQRLWDGILTDKFPADELVGPILVIDGLLGIGAKGPLREPLLDLASEMGMLRKSSGALVISVDLPSGTDPDSGEIFANSVIADRTFMIGAAKVGLLKACAADATGSLTLVKVPGLSGGEGEMDLISPQTMTFGKAPRPFDFHKGKAGRIGIVAGSAAFSGAALISTLGALKAGGGLVTLFARPDACEGIRARLPFEAMLKPCEDPTQLLDERLDSLVIGPGLGEMSVDYEKNLLQLMSCSRVPTVIDADGLNLLSKHKLKLGSTHILTPHPGEFSRLAPDLDEKSREAAAGEFSAKSNAILLLKGARTIVAKSGMPLRINSTGTPAMSNGGQGDLLSGVIGALLASGMNPFDAAAFGAWICGHAAELSVRENGAVCMATDTAAKIGLAIHAWRRSSR